MVPLTQEQAAHARDEAAKLGVNVGQPAAAFPDRIKYKPTPREAAPKTEELESRISEYTKRCVVGLC